MAVLVGRLACAGPVVLRRLAAVLLVAGEESLPQVDRGQSAAQGRGGKDRYAGDLRKDGPGPCVVREVLGGVAQPL